ncbi:conjugal transfer protein TraH [Rahnella sp. L72c]|uniref:Conjugal transfer protein TraH n=1 Tax=Rahnella perminowiae TaxID=2816244 RepID=A0ABS6KVQ0_9GAMM|nr:conjugal transfer protein TraH [Rahnella perminowiae]MBU9833691.1 conjugal transfer protein TraH [Rahnella perminowiae]
MKITTITCLIGLLLAAPVCADVNSDMNNFFGKLGFDGNTSRPQVWQGQVIALLKGIQDKAVSDDPLSVAEKGFLEATSIPVLRYLVDPLSVNIGPAVVYQLADYIGYDIMMQYMNEMIKQVRTLMGGKSYPGEVADQLDKNLAQATTLIAELQTRVQIKQDAVMAVERQMSYLRQQVSSRLIQRYQGNYRFTGE